MGLSIYLFAGPTDSRCLCELCQSVGLRMYPILMNQPEMVPTDDPAARPFCFLSFLAREELHPYGNPPRISDATDPLLELMFPYFKNNLLVIGRIFCSNDVPDLFRITKPWFRKLAKWIRGNWEKLPTGQYVGPEAKSLLEAGAKLAYFPPGVPIEIKDLSETS